MNWTTEKRLMYRCTYNKVYPGKINNNFLDYLLLWLDGENSTEMPKIESATDDTIGEDEGESLDDDE